MSRRGRRPVDYYEEDEEEEIREELIDEPSRRRRDLDERYVEPELESSRHRRRPGPLRREPTPPHLIREVEELIRTREKAREEPERLVRRSRGDDNDDVRRYEKDYLEEDVDDKRDRLPEREETEEMYIRRGSLPPRDRSRRRRVSRDDERLERRRSRDEEDVMLETKELSPPVYKDKFDQILREDEKRTRRRRAKSREVEESEFEERDEAEIPIRRRNRSPLRDEIIADKLRRRSLLSQDERDEEKERLFRHRDRSPRRHLVRDDREEILLRHRDASLPPRDEPERIRRRRSLPGYDEEEDDIFLRRRDHSVPARDNRGDEILIRHKERPPHADRDEIRIRHHERSGSERDDDRDEVRIRRKERLHSHRDAEDDFLEEVRVRRRHSLPPEDEEEDEVIRPRRLVEDDEREEILVHRGRRDHNKKPLASGGGRDEIYIRDEPGREKVEFRHTHGPPSVKSSQSRQGSVEREDIIRLSEHKGRAGRSRLEKELSRQSEAASSSESLPEPPSVIRKPPIVQEVITHHRHIESYEKASPSQRLSVDDTKSRAGIDEVELRERDDRNGDIHEDITIEHRHKDRSPSLRRQSPVEEAEEEIILRSRSDDGHHSRSKEIMILEREPERDYLAEDLDRVKEKRKKRYTEVTKELVVREAIERAGYDYDETDHDYYIYDYLRYDDVSRLVEMTEDIRQSRRERVRRERDILPPPHLPPAPRLPMRDVYRERDVLVEGTRPRRRYREV